MKRSFNLNQMLIGLCFAIPAGVLYWFPEGSFGTPSWMIMFSASFLSAFLTALVIWPRVVKDPADLQQGLKAGAIIGTAAHLVAIVLFFLFGFVAVLLGVSLLPSGNPMTLADYFDLVAFVLFWWMVYAFMLVLWVTLVVGGIVGGLISIVNRISEKAQTERTTRANLLALILIMVICGLIIVFGKSQTNRAELQEGPATSVEGF